MSIGIIPEAYHSGCPYRKERADHMTVSRPSFQQKQMKVFSVNVFRSMPSLPDRSHSPFRLTEKHFKNRAVQGLLPSLRSHSVLDLSRPTHPEDDDIYKAGWWGVSEQGDTRKSWKRKARDSGERPKTDGGERLRKVNLSSGPEGWIVTEGTPDR